MRSLHQYLIDLTSTKIFNLLHNTPTFPISFKFFLFINITFSFSFSFSSYSTFSIFFIIKFLKSTLHIRNLASSNTCLNSLCQMAQIFIILILIFIFIGIHIGIHIGILTKRTISQSMSILTTITIIIGIILRRSMQLMHIK